MSIQREDVLSLLNCFTCSLFPESGGINFGLWFVFAAPAMVLALLLSWLYLSFLYCDDTEVDTSLHTTIEIHFLGWKSIHM